ncbi:MAG TPA: molybdopterin converting factor subunit 1 [Cyclobacteriaceae bacterium]|jgi:molybdopterin converting factor subunit 1
MKNIRIKAFGITREILGQREIQMQLHDGHTVADMRSQLLSAYPRVKALKSLFVAVNNEYAEDELVLREDDEIALIPPVSGG